MVDDMPGFLPNTGDAGGVSNNIAAGIRPSPLPLVAGPSSLGALLTVWWPKSCGVVELGPVVVVVLWLGALAAYKACWYGRMLLDHFALPLSWTGRKGTTCLASIACPALTGERRCWDRSTSSASLSCAPVVRQGCQGRAARCVWMPSPCSLLVWP